MDFDTRFESDLRELERSVGPRNKYVVAHCFLKKLRRPQENESQVITGAMNKFEYQALRGSTV
eukprot:10643442-Alexandrium_andersonii.AAC.1